MIDELAKAIAAARAESRLRNSLFECPSDEIARAVYPLFAARIEQLEAALGNISRMKLFPDDKINRTTLQAAMNIARAALGEKA
jgi:hypothetical protein